MRLLPLLALALVLAACAPHRFETSGHAAPAAAAATQAEAVPSPGRRLEVSVRLPEGGERTMDVAEAMAALDVPSLGVALIEDGEVAWSEGLGSGVTAATPFQAADLSMAVTAVTALALVQEGFLTLDDDIGQWVEAWRIAIPGHPVTLRGLLSHTGGINTVGFEGYAPDAPLPTPLQTLGGVAPANNDPVAVATVPGSGHGYAPGGFVIAELAMQGSSGVDFAELARALVLVPAGMSASAFEMPPGTTIAVIAAPGHDTAGAPLPGGWRIFPERGAMGLWSTPGDMARFLVDLRRSWAGTGGPLQQPVARDIAHRPNDAPWGLGFRVTGEGRDLALHKHGASPGYRAYMVLFPETGQGAVVMTGSDNGDALIEGVLRRLGDLHDWPWDGALAD